MNPWLPRLLVALVVYAVLVWLASRSVYFPMQYPSGQWDLQKQHGAEDVWFTADGVRLHGWLIRHPGARRVTLHLHGNAGNLTHRVLSAKHIYDAGSSVLLFDYRGYGRSEGRPTERGLYADGDAAYYYLLNAGWTADDIVLHGESLGTAVATHLALRRRCAGVVLEAPFSSARAVAGRMLPFLGPLLIWGFDTARKIRGLEVPLLVIHGDRDEVIAYQLGKDVFDAAPPGRKQMWTIAGGTHNDLHLVAAAEFVTRLRAFYQQLAPDRGRLAGQ